MAEDYHGAPEWGGPFGGAVAAALDQALIVQAEQANQVVAQVSAAVIGVSQATNAYQAGAQDMAATVQDEAVKAAESGNFSYFDYLQGS